MRRKSIIIYRGEHCPVPERECNECSYLWEGECCLIREKEEEENGKKET